MKLEKAVEIIINEVLDGRGFKDIETLNSNGIVLSKIEFTHILDVLKKCGLEEYTVRGTTQVPKIFTASYDGNYFTSERMLDEIYINKTTISYNYENLEKLKMFISHSNWIDFHFWYNDLSCSFASMTIVPK